MNDILKGRIYKALGAATIALASATATYVSQEDPIDVQAVAIAGAMVTWHEGRKLVPYIDPVGVLTVCEGVTGPDVVRGKTYTNAECDALRDKHLSVAKLSAKRVISTWGNLNRWERAALIDFTYNLGETKLRSSTLASMFNRGDRKGGCAQLNLWVNGRVNGKLVPLGGLVARRSDETELCIGALGV